MDLEAISEQVSTHLLQVGQNSLKVLAALVAAVLILVVGLYPNWALTNYASALGWANRRRTSFRLCWLGR